MRKTLTTLPERRFSFVLQDDGTPRFALGVDNNDDSVLYRADANGEWKRQPDEMAKSLFPFHIDVDNKNVYAYQSKRGAPQKLVRFSLENGATTLMADAGFANVGTLDWALGKRDIPIGWRPSTGKPVITYFDPTDVDAQLHKSLASQFSGSDLRFTDSSQDGQRLIF